MVKDNLVTDIDLGGIDILPGFSISDEPPYGQPTL